MYEEMRILIDEIGRLEPSQRGPYQTWLIVWLIRDVAYYVVLGLVVWALGRRLIQAGQAALRESRRERA